MTMEDLGKYQPYPAYKESGIEWLGKVPEHWESIAVWLLFEIGRGRVISNEEIIDNSGDYPVYSSQTENDGVMGNIASYDFHGDYLTWTTDGANAGTVFRRKGKFNCTNVCGTLKARDKKAVLDYCVYALSISTGYFVRQDTAFLMSIDYFVYLWRQGVAALRPLLRSRSATLCRHGCTLSK